MFIYKERTDTMRMSSEIKNENKSAFYKKSVIFSYLFLLIIAAIVILYLYKDSIEDTNMFVTKQAEVVEAGIPKSIIMNLIYDSNNFDIFNNNEYLELKNNLSSLLNINNDIKCFYLIDLKNAKTYPLVNSEHNYSEKSFSGEDIYTSLNEDDLLENDFNKTVLTKKYTNKNGDWINVLIPIHDTKNNEVIASLKVVYPIKIWNYKIFIRVIHTTIFFIATILIILAFHILYIKSTTIKIEKRKLEDITAQLKKNETMLWTVFDQAPIGVAVLQNFDYYSDINITFEKITGRSKEELNGMKWMTITHPDDLQISLEKFNNLKKNNNGVYSLNKRYIKPDGTAVWVNVTIAPLHFENNDEVTYHMCLVENIDDRVQKEYALSESKRSKDVILANLPGMAYRCKHDKDWTMQFVSEGCLSLTGFKPESFINNKELAYNDIIVTEYRESIWQAIELLPTKKTYNFEYEIITKSNERKWVLEIGQGIFNDKDELIALEGIVIDNHEQKLREKQIMFMLDHDYLTGLFNRKYYEEAIKKLDKNKNLPLTMVITDINGVRLINDAFGYSRGDKLIKETANLLQSCCRSGDVLARLGGDEFGFILPNTDNEKADKFVNAIIKACAEYNKNKKNKLFEMNISIGYATKVSAYEDINDIMKSADDYMRNKKLLNRKSIHNEIISSIMATMYEKSEETEEHAKRLSRICKKIGDQLKLNQKNMSELELFAMLHDIGKVAIDDRILKKPGKFNDDEWIIMKSHPEIGYRIAKSASEIEPISEYILTHHERWDGKGYPRGLNGEEIPLLSRILAVADSFDAMTNDRIYRKAMSLEYAITEINKNSGSQFDPQVVEVFQEIIYDL